MIIPINAAWYILMKPIDSFANPSLLTHSLPTLGITNYKHFLSTRPKELRGNAQSTEAISCSYQHFLNAKSLFSIQKNTS